MLRILCARQESQRRKRSLPIQQRLHDYLGSESRPMVKMCRPAGLIL